MDVEPDFELINGVAFTKGLVHSSMPISMTNVSLMLLSGTISYERVKDDIYGLLKKVDFLFRYSRNSPQSNH
jgi:hypothetical protein